MKLYIKQSIFTLGEKFTVKNATGADEFYVDGSFMRIPKQFIIYNNQQQQVATIERQMFRLFPRYDIQTGDKHITLKREFAFFRQAYVIEGIDWSLKGNFTGHHYQVVKGEDPIMTLRKHWFTWGDSYELDIPDDHDALLALCIAVSVDYEIFKDQSNANNSA